MKVHKAVNQKVLVAFDQQKLAQMARGPVCCSRKPEDSILRQQGGALPVYLVQRA